MENRSEWTLHVRYLAHWITSAVIMGFYGGQVCPLVDSLDMNTWIIELFFIFTAFLVLRFLLVPPYLGRLEFRKIVSCQFFSEFLVCILTGIAIAGVNLFLYDFPPVKSGLKMVIGMGALGFFMAVDLSLLRERIIDRELFRTGSELEVDEHFFPMTRKFAIVAGVTAVLVSTIVLLVILKDLGWMTGVQSIDPQEARISVVKEILFITAIFLAHIFNLIFSYSQNLKLAVNKENRALMEVADGNLETNVTVSTNDEFGIMANYTNQMIQQLARSNRQLMQTRDATIMALAGLAETRDNETGAHILRTQNYVKSMADHLQNHPRFRDFLEQSVIDLLYQSAPLHDIGKVGIPDRILLKPGKLEKEEFEIMKKHTVYGRDALQRAAQDLEENNFLVFAQQIACSHHEKWDGSGYPQGLQGDEIPIAGRLMAVADVYDALISKRVYKPAFSHEKAKSIIIEGRGTHFDPDMIDAFLEIETEFTAIASKFSDNREPGF